MSTNTAEEILRVEPNQILDYVTGAGHRGKYFAFKPDIERWVGVDRTGGSVRTEVFAEKHEVFAFLAKPAEEDTTVVGIDAPWPDVPLDKPAVADFVQKTEAALDFIPVGDPIPYDAGIQGLSFLISPDEPPKTLGAAAGVPAEPAWMQEAIDHGSDELEGDEVVVEPPAADDRQALLLTCAQNLTKLEGVYFAKLRTHQDLEAELKRKQNDFNTANAVLIDNKKLASSAMLAAETDLKAALVAWGKLSSDKKFDEYLSVMETSIYEIDEAEATTWAQQNYPAALNTILNQKLLIDYIKTTKKFLSFVKVTKEIAPKISRKV
jgi:hypothetical protein